MGEEIFGGGSVPSSGSDRSSALNTGTSFSELRQKSSFKTYGRKQIAKPKTPFLEAEERVILLILCVVVPLVIELFSHFVTKTQCLGADDLLAYIAVVSGTVVLAVQLRHTVHEQKRRDVRDDRLRQQDLERLRPCLVLRLIDVDDDFICVEACNYGGRPVRCLTWGDYIVAEKLESGERIEFEIPYEILFAYRAPNSDEDWGAIPVSVMSYDIAGRLWLMDYVLESGELRPEGIAGRIDDEFFATSDC